MSFIATILYRVRKIFWWQLTVSQVNFITEDGASTVWKIHPAWWSKQRVYEEALYDHMPNMIGEAEL